MLQASLKCVRKAAQQSRLSRDVTQKSLVTAKQEVWSLNQHTNQKLSHYRPSVAQRVG